MIVREVVRDRMAAARADRAVRGVASDGSTPIELAKARAVVNTRERRCEGYNLVREVKLTGCVDCGYNRHPAALDLHHMDPEDKSDMISRIVLTGNLAALRREIEKCIVLCANCHRVRHATDVPKVARYSHP